MYTLPKPSNGAPTAMSEERWGRVTRHTRPHGPVTLCSRPLSPAWWWPHRSSDFTLAEVFRAAEKEPQSSRALVAMEAQERGRNFLKVTQQASATDRAMRHIPQQNPAFPTFHIPNNHLSGYLGSSNDIYYQDQKRSHSPWITTSTVLTASISFNPYKNAVCVCM